MSVEKKVIEKTIVYGKNYAKQVIHHPLLKEIFENYSTFAFEQMFYQFMLQEMMEVKTMGKIISPMMNLVRKDYFALNLPQIGWKQVL